MSLWLSGDGYVATIQICVREALGIREANLCRVRHRGVPVAAVGQNDQLVCAFVQLEGCCAKACLAQYLIGLLDARSAEIIYGEIQAAADVGWLRAGNTGVWRLLQLDANHEVALGDLGCNILRNGHLLASDQCPEYAKGQYGLYESKQCY